MTPTELKLLKQAAEDAAATRQLLETHTEQISLIFTELRTHADKITAIQTKQDICLRNNDPGNKSERIGLIAAIAFGVISILWQLFSLLK